MNEVKLPTAGPDLDTAPEPPRFTDGFAGDPQQGHDRQGVQFSPEAACA